MAEDWIVWVHRCFCTAILEKRDPRDVIVCGCGRTWGAYSVAPCGHDAALCPFLQGNPTPVRTSPFAP